jgi:hypothetical protein
MYVTNRRFAPFLLSLIASVFLNASAANAQVPPSPTPAVNFKKVILVVLENTRYEVAVAQPFLSKLASSGVLFTNFTAESHPSQANYIALVSGDEQGVLGDKKVDLNVNHLGDLLEPKGRDWRVYAEGYPGGCFQGMTSGKYVRKHNPFISFKNVQNNVDRCAKIVEAKQFDSDLAAGHLPDFSLYIPDLDNDGHDTGIAYADQWMSQRFSALLADSKAMQDILFIVTCDENDGTAGNKIFTTFNGVNVLPGVQNASSLNHYSILKLIEDEWGLGNLGRLDASAAPVIGVFK